MISNVYFNRLRIDRTSRRFANDPTFPRDSRLNRLCSPLRLVAREEFLPGHKHFTDRQLPFRTQSRDTAAAKPVCEL